MIMNKNFIEKCYTANDKARKSITSQMLHCNFEISASGGVGPKYCVSIRLPGQFKYEMR